MHVTKERQEGWFPVIGMKFDKLSDLLIVFVTACVAIILVLLILVQGSKLIRKAVKTVVLLLLGALIPVFALIIETTISIYHTLLRIPWSWYIITALTILPMAIDIPKNTMVWFLAAYCVPNAWIAAYGADIPKPKKEPKAKPPPPPPPIPVTHTASHSLFSGMRISV